MRITQRKLGWLAAAAVMAVSLTAVAAETAAPAAPAFPPGTPRPGDGFMPGRPLPPQRVEPLDGTYLYVTLPGVGDDVEQGGEGIAIFDADDGYKFIRRIYFPQLRPNAPEASKGVMASVATGLLYTAVTNRLIALNPETERIVWMNGYDGWCCDRGDISPDGQIIYQAALNDARWYVVSALNGQLITTVDVPTRAHNTVYSPKGDVVYLSPANPIIYMVDARKHKVIREIGPFSARLRPFVINGAETRVYTSVNGVLGVGVADINTGKVLAEVAVPTLQCSRASGHGGQCTHGTALTPDETEIWVADGSNNAPGGYVHVFDNTKALPVFKQSVPTRAPVGWITCSMDGKRIYPSSGDVIDKASKKVIAVLTDEEGRKVESEKVLELKFAKGKMVAVGDQWCNGKKGAPQRDLTASAE